MKTAREIAEEVIQLSDVYCEQPSKIFKLSEASLITFINGKLNILRRRYGGDMSDELRDKTKESQ